MSMAMVSQSFTLASSNQVTWPRVTHLLSLCFKDAFGCSGWTVFHRFGTDHQSYSLFLQKDRCEASAIVMKYTTHKCIICTSSTDDSHPRSVMTYKTNQTKCANSKIILRCHSSIYWTQQTFPNQARWGAEFYPQFIRGDQTDILIRKPTTIEF